MGISGIDAYRTVYAKRLGKCRGYGCCIGEREKILDSSVLVRYNGSKKW
jgi:hypothetical protein